MSRSDWDEKAKFMRDHDAVVATWSSDDLLLSLQLAPSRHETTNSETQNASPIMTAEQQFAERRRIALGAVSGLRRAPRE